VLGGRRVQHADLASEPYLQGYEAVDAVWLYLVNGDTVGGGQAVLTGPSFIDSSNVAAVARYAARGTR
jgi:simple sugar transport system substrate-binding protein